MRRWYRFINYFFLALLLSCPVIGFLAADPERPFKRNWILDSPLFGASFALVLCVWGVTNLICHEWYLADIDVSRRKWRENLPRWLGWLCPPRRSTAHDRWGAVFMFSFAILMATVTLVFGMMKWLSIDK
jgi:hypothetical protein